MGLEVAAFALVGGLTATSIYSSEKARKETKRANRAQQRIEERKTQRERISQLRESQVARAQVAVQGQGAGSGEASTTQGVQSSITTQAASNIQFINSIESLRQEISRRMERASSFAATAQVTGQLASLGASFVKGSPGGAPAAASPNTTLGNVS